MFKIGEFAAITQIPVSQLRYYDDIDLFKPAEINNDTGYRYYSAEQIPRLNRIIVLKDLGFSLEQIHSLMRDNIENEDIHRILIRQREQVIETLKTEIEKLRHIESRLEQMNQGGNLSTHRVIIKPVPEQRYLAARQVSQENAMEQVMSEVYAARGRIISRKPPQLMSIFHSQQTRAHQQIDWEVGYVVEKNYKYEFKLPSGLPMQIKTLPPIDEMASLVYDGEWDGGRTAYIELGRWMEQNDYRIAGAFRKVFLKMNDPTLNRRAVVEIQIPIAPR